MQQNAHQQVNPPSGALASKYRQQAPTGSKRKNARGSGSDAASIPIAQHQAQQKMIYIPAMQVRSDAVLNSDPDNESKM